MLWPVRWGSRWTVALPLLGDANRHRLFILRKRPTEGMHRRRTVSQKPEESWSLQSAYCIRSGCCRAGVQRDTVPLSRVEGADPHQGAGWKALLWVQGRSVLVRSRADSPAQSVDACANQYWGYYLTQMGARNVRLRREIWKKRKEWKSDEAHKTQWPGRQKRCLQCEAQWPEFRSREQRPYRFGDVEVQCLYWYN